MGGVARFVLLRILGAVPTLLLASVAVFLLIRLVPGDPAAIMAGEAATTADIEAVRASLGLSGSLPEQFLRWLGRALSGDLGRSIGSGDPVLPLILDRFAVSASVVLVAVALAAALAVPAGMLAAWRQGGVLDLAVVATSSVLLSIPAFWMGLILLLVFGLTLGWLPVVGYVPLSESLWAGILSLVLPILTLTIVEFGVVTRMARAATLDVLRLEYVAHARAKGLPESRVMLVHALPNAFAPTWTLLGLILGNLLGGIAVVETVFTLPGLGRLLVEAIYARDYPGVQGCLLFVAAIYVVVNTIVDLCLPLFDPRVAS